ncbi:MAG: competence/damage-inducible protein A [Candidatus Aminicenantales bacterium]
MAIGSELLTPHFQDTNSLYLTRRLNDLGMEVKVKTIVGDEPESLSFGVQKALSYSEFIIAMGGLGPTEDDRTREIFAEVLHRKLVFNEEILHKIEERFRRRGISMPASNRKQAYVIEGAEVLENKNGTAPGLWLETERSRIVLLPGPPHELIPMFEESVWPRLQRSGGSALARKVLKIAGMTESEVEDHLVGLYRHIKNVSLTVLAAPGQIEIHLAASSEKGRKDAENRIRRVEERLLERLKENVFSDSSEELEEVVGKLLRDRNLTLATAESCTGGFLSHRLTNTSGSSDYFIQGIVAYSNLAKNQCLGVPMDLIQAHGAVSSEVAQAMAAGVRERSGASFGLAITGIAGPTGGTPEKPVGSVYTALAFKAGIEVKKNLFLGKREAIKFQSSQKALDMLRRFLLPRRNHED